MRSLVKSLEHGESQGRFRLAFVLAHLSCYHIVDGKNFTIGDTVECEYCDLQAATMQQLREHKSEILHARYRPQFGGTYSFYRHDNESPSGKMLMASLDANPTVEAFLAEIQCAPLSPTEFLYSDVH